NVNVGAAFNAMFDITFFFKPPKYRPRRGFLHEVTVRQLLTHIFCCRFAAFPYNVHDKLFEVTQVLSCAKHCSATKCSDNPYACNEANFARAFWRHLLMFAALAANRVFGVLNVANHLRLESEL